MLPSKGYFKTFNCPHFEIGRCDRLHCHFRHIKSGELFPERIDNEISQKEDLGLKTCLNQSIDELDIGSNSDRTSDVSLSSHNRVGLASKYRSTTSYKPTPISELRKRHDEESKTSNNSTCPIKTSKDPQTLTADASHNSESLSDYKATKIFETGKATIIDKGKILNTAPKKTDKEGDDSLHQVTEESEEDLDYFELNTAFNCLGEFLNECDGVENAKCSDSRGEEQDKESKNKIEENTTKPVIDDTTSQVVNAHKHQPKTKDKEEGKEKRSSSSHTKIHKPKEKPSSSSKSSTHRHGDSKEKIREHLSETHKHNKQHKSNHEKNNKCPDHDRKKEYASKSKKSDHDSTYKKDIDKNADCKSTKKESDVLHNSNKMSKNGSNDKKERDSSKSSKESKHSTTELKKAKSAHSKDDVHKSNHKHHSRSARSKDSSRSTKHSGRRSGSRENKDKGTSHGNDSKSGMKKAPKRPMKPLFDRNEYEGIQNYSKRRRLKTGDIDHEDDDDVEIIIDSDSIIVIDSEDESGNDEMIECISISPSLSPDRSQILPSDVSLSGSDDDKAKTTNTITLPGKDDTTLLDNRVLSHVKKRVSLGYTHRQPVKKRAQIITPAARLALFQNQIKEQEDKQSQACVKIGSVPNVKSLLEEKKRLLTMASSEPKKLHKTMVMRQSNVAKAFQQQSQTAVQQSSRFSGKDEPPIVVKTRHPNNNGADLQTRQDNIEFMYQVTRQLVKPNQTYKDAQKQCLEIEHKIWEATTYKDYCKTMKEEISCLWSEVPSFTLKYFRALIKQKPSLYNKDAQKVLRSQGVEENKSFYNALTKYLLTSEQLEAEGYPKMKMLDDNSCVAYISEESEERYKIMLPKPPPGKVVCHNCVHFYTVDERGLSTETSCSYHAKKSTYYEGPRGNRRLMYWCCGKSQKNPCMTSEHHSTETKTNSCLKGFVETANPVFPEPSQGWGVYAIDCEMYWSVEGKELGRVTVVNAENRIVYDTFVKPDKLVTDYSTRLSGLTEENLKNAPLTFDQVQDHVLNLVKAKTILIGHSLDNDLKALKIIHSYVVDTAVVFTANGRKKALKHLVKEVLHESIQTGEDGHNSAEDAIACMKLMLHKISKSVPHLNKPKAPVLKTRYSGPRPV